MADRLEMTRKLHERFDAARSGDRREKMTVAIELLKAATGECEQDELNRFRFCDLAGVLVDEAREEFKRVL